MIPKCSGCGRDHSKKYSGSVFCGHCTKHRLTNLPWSRYLAALRRFRAMVADGVVALTGFDCDATGYKSTEVSWGLCSTSRTQWPDAKDHIWPYDFQAEGRSAPLHQQTHQLCPFDSQVGAEGESYGCFYRCAFFHRDQLEKHSHLDSTSRPAVLARYDELIAATEARLEAAK